MALLQAKEIRRAANEAFSNREYLKAFQILWTAGVFEFIRFGGTQSVHVDDKCYNWFTHPESAKPFWTVFLCDDSILEIVCTSDYYEELFHNYYTKSSFHFASFESNLAAKHPNEFVRAVRLNQAYLNPERHGYLRSLPLQESIRIHQKTWCKIYDTDHVIWNDIQKSLGEVSSYNLKDILSHCIIWLETNRFNHDNKEIVHRFAAVYSFFMELILSNYPEKSNEVIEGEAFFCYDFAPLVSALHQNQELLDDSPIVTLLSGINAWINYRDCVIAPYSYDLNIQPKQENELLLFTGSPESLYQWRLNGARYEVNRLNYINRGHLSVEDLENNNLTKIPGKNEADIELNRTLLGLTWATVLLLKDMGIECFSYNDNEILVLEIISPLTAYSFNRLDRYERSLLNHTIDSKNWTEAFIKQCSESMRSDILKWPFELISRELFQQFYLNADGKLSVEVFDKIFETFGYDAVGKNVFSRYNLEYDVFQKPFLKIGNNLFFPMMFFATNIWFYPFAQEALTRKKWLKTERGETRQMEIHFGTLFNQKGWQVKVISDKEANEIDGDVDIIVEDESALLFIQLKRTYFRLTLKDAYYESINSDKKAGQQLSRAEIYLKDENSIYTIRKAPRKWIVSTSFENIGTPIKDCIKVNYFEVINALNNPEIKTLSDLIIDVERDRSLKKMGFRVFDPNVPGEIKKLISELGLPLEKFDISAYRQPIFSDDDLVTEHYNGLFNKATELDRKGERNEALITLQECLKLNPNDAEVYFSIATTLTNLKSYELAFPLFQKALELAPNDPYFLRDYSLALMESGKFYEALCIALIVYEKYPLMEDAYLLFEGHFFQCIKFGKLNEEQIDELYNKWNRLN